MPMIGGAYDVNKLLREQRPHPFDDLTRSRIPERLLGGHTSQKYRTIEIIQEINEVNMSVQPVLTKAVEANQQILT